MAGFEPATSGLRTAVRPYTCILQDTNCADLNSARHGQFQEEDKNTLTTEFNIFLSKIFRRKITIICFNDLNLVFQGTEENSYNTFRY